MLEKKKLYIFEKDSWMMFLEWHHANAPRHCIQEHIKSYVMRCIFTGAPNHRFFLIVKPASAEVRRRMEMERRTRRRPCHPLSLERHSVVCRLRYRVVRPTYRSTWYNRFSPANRPTP